jgi:hypothetical protein
LTTAAILLWRPGGGIPPGEWADMVQCAECGFLSLRKIKTRQLVEAELDVRQTWTLPQDASHNPRSYAPPGPYDKQPWCYAMAADLASEARQETAGITWGGLAVITKERVCPSFTPWRPGFTPKDHQHMIELEQSRLWQKEQRSRERQWQEEQREKDRRWQAEQKQADRRWQLVLTVIAPIVATIISAIGFAVGILFGR